MLETAWQRTPMAGVRGESRTGDRGSNENTLMKVAIVCNATHGSDPISPKTYDLHWPRGNYSAIEASYIVVRFSIYFRFC